MADRAVNKRVWTRRSVSKATRWLGGELKRRPAFLKGLEPRLAVSNSVPGIADGKLLVDGKEVVPREEALAAIKAFDDDPRYSGGRDRLYGHIAKRHVGITRRMVLDYVTNSEVHQLTRPKPPVIRHRAILVKAPGKQAQVDLIGPMPDEKLNNGYSYVLTYVDLFSKWAAARPLRNKEGPTVIAAVDSVLEALKPEHRPRVLQSDRGSEFSVAFAAHLKAKWGIKCVRSSAYKPTTQGQVERLNGTLKALLFAHMKRFDSKRWVDILQACVDNINSTKHGSTGHSPAEVLEDPSLRAEVAEKLEASAAQRQPLVDKKEADLGVGDSVRVALSTRELVRKAGLFAGSAGRQHWSERVYTVRAISKPKLAFQRPQFLLSFGARKLKKRYFASQLLKVDLGKLIRNDQDITTRPTYDPALFNNEAHLRVDLPGRVAREEKKAPPPPEPAPALPPPQEPERDEARGPARRPQRERKLPGRLRDYEVS